VTPPDQKPLLVVADDDPGSRAAVVAELERRYADDYAVRACSLDEADAELERAHTAGEEVALVLSADERGCRVLARVRGRFPAARRGLLIPWLGWADPQQKETVLNAMTST
jgi:hypothetical protein